MSFYQPRRTPPPGVKLATSPLHPTNRTLPAKVRTLTSVGTSTVGLPTSHAQNSGPTPAPWKARSTSCRHSAPCLPTSISVPQPTSPRILVCWRANAQPAQVQTLTPVSSSSSPPLLCVTTTPTAGSIASIPPSTSLSDARNGPAVDHRLPGLPCPAMHINCSTLTP